ncbi:hypothetical protein BOTBODRAFT_63154 [Botryobasidium botryosum FD-172 SS1]|uniref:Uncharacterized protein n=1 Tax=Botryobasidium botryosum (strain FD-172 SS1) TaxID=930990 RepID=A0A067MWD9_BOTB1|nr:hypothetical protein BOTBODRAFT_63154 [Botryobasidium botryosum FD-172 SS1]
MADSEQRSTTSTRYSRFHSAYVLATKKASSKWTYEDFAQCFPTWAAESSEGVAQIRAQLSQHMREQTLKQADEILQAYNAAAAIDELQTVISAGRARVSTSDKGKDMWKADLDPKAAARARTVPILKSERDRLLEALREVEAKNVELAKQVEASRNGRISANSKAKDILKALDEAVAEFNNLPVEEMEEWIVETEENGMT